MKGIIHDFGKRGVTLEERLRQLKVVSVVWPHTRQIHSDRIHCITRSSKEMLEGDAFVTNERGVVCFVRTADCVPMLIADPVTRAVGAIHAGWRGTAKEIAVKTVHFMTQSFGTRPQDLTVAIGPAICQRCYEVGREVAKALGQPTATHIDLVALNRAQLMSANIPEGHIKTLNLCTCCSNENLASYRRDQTSDRQVSFIYCW